MSIKTARVAALAAALAAVGAMSVTTASASAEEEVLIKQEMKNWGVAGHIATRNFSSDISLPENTGKFNGTLSVLNPLTRGTVNGTFSVPLFTARYPSVPGVKLGLEFSSGNLNASFENLSKWTATATAIMAIEVLVEGERPVALCETKEPITFQLGGEESIFEVGAQPLHLNGSDTFPGITCIAGTPEEAKTAGEVLTHAFAGTGRGTNLYLSRPPE